MSRTAAISRGRTSDPSVCRTALWMMTCVILGCAGDVRYSSGGDGAGGSGVGPGGGAAPYGCTLDGSDHVPLEGSGGAPSPSGSGVTFAVNLLLLGNADADGTPGPDTWEDLGYDIDCRITTPDSSDVCTAAPDGTVWPDGPRGRDNNFGRLVVPMLGPGLDGASYIASGGWTLVLSFPAFDVGETVHNVVAEIYEGRDLGHSPAFDGSDVWPVASKKQLLNGYVANGVWVSGDPVALRLKVDVEGEALYVTLHHAVVTAVVSADLESATDGRIAGIIDKDELNAEFHRYVATTMPGTCEIPPNPTDMGEAADIPLTGEQDAAVTCDGISVGFGFTLRRAQLGPEVDPEPIPPDPCPPPM